MAANATWAIESSAINHHTCFEIEYTESAKFALDNSELRDSGFLALSVTAPLSDAYSEWCGSWRRPTPRY